MIASGCVQILISLAMIPRRPLPRAIGNRASIRSLMAQRINEGAMGLIAWIIVGLIAGWLAEQFTGREHGLLKNLIVGVVGAIVGGAVFTSLLGFNYYRGLNLATIFVATVGAVIFLYVLDWLRGRNEMYDRRR
jgi:uncharacterized membrane protein YeaQ/YmgE (transglycosylase-associated protein family)